MSDVWALCRRRADHHDRPRLIAGGSDRLPPVRPCAREDGGVSLWSAVLWLCAGCLSVLVAAGLVCAAVWLLVRGRR